MRLLLRKWASRLRELLLLVFFWMLWKERNMRFFYSEELFDYKVKCLFLNNFSMWVRVYIGGGYMHLIDFIEWLGIG